jgi:hypothetical protein
VPAGQSGFVPAAKILKIGYRLAAKGSDRYKGEVPGMSEHVSAHLKELVDKGEKREKDQPRRGTML